MGIKFQALGGLLVLLAASISIPAFADDKGTTNYETAMRYLIELTLKTIAISTVTTLLSDK